MLKITFLFCANAEISIEIDPREIELMLLITCDAGGFNCLSIGVQDFNKQVQYLINRQQDDGGIFVLIQRAKDMGFSPLVLI